MVTVPGNHPGAVGSPVLAGALVGFLGGDGGS